METTLRPRASRPKDLPEIGRRPLAIMALRACH
jgi:hypothetical protein